MSEIAINVQHLGKQYRLGGKQASYSTFRETLVNAANVPLQWLKGERKKELNTFWALDDVSFEVNQGDAIGIIGRNGAGKSTLLKILSRITSPTRGRVDIYGRVGTLLEVGTGFHPELTGRENIYLNGAILGMSRVEIQRKFDEIVAFSEIERFLDTPVKHYSSGMYVRLAFAVAAHLEPEILVVDEVLAVGDAAFQKKCLGKMGDVAHEGRTVLFVSHNMNAIKRLCAKTIYLEKGQISFYGDTAEAVQNYKGDIKDNWLAIFSPDSSKVIRISKIEISPLNSQSRDELDTADGFLIRIEYDINRPTRGIHAFIRIHMDDGETLLASGDADTAPERLGIRNPGRQICEIQIPPRILGAGRYTITWSAGIPFLENFDVEFHALTFHVVDQKGLRRNFIHKDRPGILALDLDWNYENH
jgi:lipopolysaccharide transport system ATP-binding protein